MGRFVIRVAVFLGIMLIVFKLVEAFVNAGLRSSQAHYYHDIELAHGGNMTPDIAVLGSSRTFVHYDPDIIEDSTGLSCYNLGIDGGCQTMQFAVWKNVINNNPTPKVVVQNVEFLSFGKRKNLFDKERYLPYLGLDYFYEPLSLIDSALWQDRYVPFFRYHGHWELIQDALRSWAGKEPLRPYKQNRGHLYKEQDFQGEEVINDFPLQPEDMELGKRLMGELIADCEASNSSLILLYAPEYTGGNNTPNAQVEEMVAFFQEVSKAHDLVEFWDLRDMEISADKQYFADRYHLNITGAKVFSSEVGHRLNKFIEAKGIN